jgi:hypothetical protein
MSVVLQNLEGGWSQTLTFSWRLKCRQAYPRNIYQWYIIYLRGSHTLWGCDSKNNTYNLRDALWCTVTGIAYIALQLTVLTVSYRILLYSCEKFREIFRWLQPRFPKAPVLNLTYWLFRHVHEDNHILNNKATAPLEYVAIHKSDTVV